MTKKHKMLHNKSALDFKKTRLSEAVTGAIFASFFVSAPLAAQQSEASSEDDVEVITVTATKRSESVQEVALAVTAITSDFMQKTRMTDAKDVINFTPGVTGNSADSFLDAISIRGVRTDDYGAGGDMSIGIFKNDFYEGRAGSAVSSFFDMDRTEIARGPQGFLFGRNAIGGVISNHTRQADFESSEKIINAEIGEYGRVRIDGAVNVPINDNLAMRFAGLYHQEDSYMENLFPGSPIGETDTVALRWSTNYENENFKLFTMVEYENRERPSTIYRTIAEGEIYDAFTEIWGDIDVPDDPFQTNSNSIFGFEDNLEQLNIQLKLEKELDFANLVLNVAHKDHDYLYTEDWEGSEFRNGSWKADQSGDYSQAELRLVSNTDSKLKWYGGLSYYTEDLTVDTTSLLNQDMMCQYATGYINYYFGTAMEGVNTCEGLANYLNYAFGEYYANYYFGVTDTWDGRRVAEQTFVDAKNSGWAAYLNMNYQITDSIDAEFGIRRTKDDKELWNTLASDAQLGDNFWAFYNYGVTSDGALYGDESWSDTNIKVLFRWRPTDDRMFYVSFTEGYKAGGFTTLSVTSPDGGDAFGFFNVSQADGYGIPTFGPENVDSYEFGYKDTWGENTDIQFTYFQYDYTGLQTVAPDPETGGTIIRNVGNVDGQGVEFALNTSFGDYWDFYFTYSWLDAEATGIQDQCTYGGAGNSIFTVDPDPNGCEGSKLYWAPEHSGAFVLTGTFPIDGGSVYTSIDYWYESERDTSFNFLPESRVEDNGILSATLGYESESEWWIEAYVENVLDDVIYDSAYDGGGFEYMPSLSVFWTPYKPRNVGIRFGYYWD